MQPCDEYVQEYDVAVFSVEVANGLEPPTFQWYRVGAGVPDEAIAGATEATYQFSPTIAEDGTMYYCIADDGSGSPITSDIVALHVASLLAQRVVAFLPGHGVRGRNVANLFRCSRLLYSQERYLHASYGLGGLL